MGVQVDELTRNKTPHETEFIDFEFDGKKISEYGLVAAFSSGYHIFTSTPPFEDEVSTVNGVSGQYYWGTLYKPLSKEYYLVTDGMTEIQLKEFKLHFQPGKYGRFIESQYPYRYSYARIESAPKFEMIPFKKKTTFMQQTFDINEYKGSVTISFVFDDPYSYSTKNCLDFAEGKDQEAKIRAMLIEGIPSTQSAPILDIKTPCFIGEGGYDSEGVYQQTLQNNNSASLYFFNPSNTDTKAQITLKFKPRFTKTSPNTGMVYFCEISDDINNYNGVKYNTLIQSQKINKIDSLKQEKKFFNYTSPNIIYSINKTISLAENFYLNSLTGCSAIELEEYLRSEIVNPKVISWAAACLGIMQNKKFYNSETGMFKVDEFINNINLTMIGGSSNESLNWLGYFNILMLSMMADKKGNNCALEEEGAANWEFPSYTIIFDGINSQTTLFYSYNSGSVEGVSKFLKGEEKSGDMICSPYLKIDGGNTLTNEGKIASFYELKNCQGNYILPIELFSLEYNYTYL